nr:sugar ABC transporter ATP-binding protein [uncultured Oscillibacter sp.]
MSYLEMREITKRFMGVTALDRVSFSADKGEVHALAGENGAGKSTLMKILSGAYQPDEGEIYLNGKKLNIKNPAAGRKEGIMVIYQELSLVPHLSIAENVFLGNMPVKNGRLDWKKMNQETKKALDEIGFDLDPKALVSSLSIVQQQGVEIAKILVEDAKVVVMDEPTAILPPKEVGTLFRVIHMLQDRGVTVLYISHRLEEIFQLAQHVTVLKDGATVGTVIPREIDQRRLVSMMIGRETDDKTYWNPEEEERLQKADIVLEAKDLRVGKELNGVSLALRQGEILGIAGLVGSGKSEIVGGIFGEVPLDQGEITVRGAPFKPSPGRALKNSIGYLTADRKSKGLVLGMTIQENITLTALHMTGNGMLLNTNNEKQATQEMIKALRIKCYGGEQPAGTLSGGNQQKVVMGKWLLPNCQILLFDEPTRGIDVGARAEIYELMDHFTSEGGSVIVVSSDTQELLKICDRILVVSNGVFTAEFRRDEATEEKIVQAMF